uniref:CheR family methyltransferase n=1 Tax=Roseihalotalea indica TaxID=2867963 RepID=A0AA49GPN7_9BACT|nr:CheR family methyltransferase [Tunicatimonas sp. TK19036]
MEAIKNSNDKPVANGKANVNKKKLYIVGIGASAGGLEAINAFFEKVPADSGLSFVLIQHLSPDYKSMMPELLAKHTMLKISKVTDAVAVQPNAIYTIPADKNITISGGKLYLEDRGSPKTLNLPINIFFKCLADDQRERAIGVVLSGTGSDATLGIEAIKQHGGMVIAQDPDSAAFDSMPKSAIATGLVDFILHPSQMPASIVNYVKHPYVEQPMVDEPEGDMDNDLFRILTLLHQKTNMDFRQYKKTTVIRRIERRMGIHNILSRSTYLKYLQEDKEEIEMLSADMLIGVTAFFRDKQAYQKLDKEVIEPMIRDHSGDRELRLWIVGCSTGQEVYSLGMLLKENCRKQNKHVPIKIFATDIDQRAIDKASKGVFYDSIEEEVPKELLHRYFIHQEGKYQVKKELREIAIFAKHDITKDPPFNNIDLASCRNVLIYIEPELQEKILSFIHFSLSEHGHLFLGSSENLGNYSKVFDEIDKKHKIFRNRSSVRIVDIHKLYPFDRKHKLADKREKPEDQAAVLSESKIINNFKDAVLEDLVPPTIIINENNDVVHVAGEVERFIKLPKKQLTLNVLKMVDEQFYVSLSNVIAKSRNQKGKITSPPVILDDKQHTAVSVVAKCYTEPVSRMSYCILSFIETKSIRTSSIGEESSNKQMNKERNAHIRQLEEDLKETKEYLQATIEELETSNEELQATNEELMAANEELQSSNEELQSVNEELYTVNSEFQDKIQEMTELNDDLNNFIQNTHIPTLFLDIDYSIKRFTEEITPYIKITRNDIGRYVGDFNHTFLSFDLIEVARKVVDTFLPIEKEVITAKDEVFLVRALPYKTAKKEVKGVVFTFVGVTELKKIEQQLVAKARELERTNQELEQFAYVASHDLKAPISNLVALLEVINKRKGINDECAPVFNKVSESVTRMNRTIRTLNEVITIKKNLDLEPEKLSLDNVLQDVLSFIDDQIVNTQAQINTNFEAGETIYFPEIHLRSILQNLITNAIKYRQKDKTPIIDIQTLEEKGQFCLLVKDNGRGINMKEYGKKLFGLFQRFHLDTEGKGIGLHIVKSIIEKYGGRIEVESKLKEGTTFKIYFKPSTTHEPYN